MCNIDRSKLYDQNTFYDAFLKDLRVARHQVVIESPFITERRVASLLPILTHLRKRDVRIIINTKPFNEHEPSYLKQIFNSVAVLQEIGIEILLTGGHHRKLAIIDSNILYEGSLNILSQSGSCELMRRINSKSSVEEMLSFTGLRKWCR